MLQSFRAKEKAKIRVASAAISFESMALSDSMTGVDEGAFTCGRCRHTPAAGVKHSHGRAKSTASTALCIVPPLVPTPSRAVVLSLWYCVVTQVLCVWCTSGVGRSSHSATDLCHPELYLHTPTAPPDCAVAGPKINFGLLCVWLHTHILRCSALATPRSRSATPQPDHRQLRDVRGGGVAEACHMAATTATTRTASAN